MFRLLLLVRILSKHERCANWRRNENPAFSGGAGWGIRASVARGNRADQVTSAMHHLLGREKVSATSSRGKRPGFRAGWRDYSCGTAPDSHRLPPLSPGFRSFEPAARQAPGHLDVIQLSLRIVIEPACFVKRAAPELETQGSRRAHSPIGATFQQAMLPARRISYRGWEMALRCPLSHSAPIYEGG